jgi:hypothetical protein
MEAYFLLCDRLREDEWKRGTGGGVSCLGASRGIGGEDRIIAVGGEDCINGDEGIGSCFSSRSCSGPFVKASDAGIVASEESS